MAQKPKGMGTLAEAFSELEAAPRWSRALEELEENSRPYLQEVQRYEEYRCPGRGAGWRPASVAEPHPQPQSPLAALHLCLSQNP